jgi:hypothetical protein
MVKKPGKRNDAQVKQLTATVEKLRTPAEGRSRHHQVESGGQASRSRDSQAGEAGQEASKGQRAAS